MAHVPPIGAHVGSGDPLEVAGAVGADCVQVFLSDPQGWRTPPPREDADALRASGIPLFVHAPYLVNLASPNPRVRHPSRKILGDTCAAAAAVGATAVIVHGGHVTVGDQVAEGIARWRKALLELDSEVPLYVENTAGGEHALARRFDALGRLWEGIGDLGVGFCLDTCHAHAAGEAVAGAVGRVLAVTGRIDLVHANDSRDPAGSGRDRHEHLGRGQLDIDALVEAVRQAGAPVVCETDLAGVGDDIAFLRHALMAGGPTGGRREWDSNPR
ncbi:MAG: deoxyribonuclease IV [Acidimicrobiales bacterium]